MKTYDVAVVGAGPAGMMAAIAASENGHRVALIEKNAQPGRKLLATGNGRCNLTNRDVVIERYHGHDSSFILKVLQRFDQNATIRFFEELGLALKEEDNGRIFPRTNQASSVVSVLLRRLRRNYVDVLLGNVVFRLHHESLWSVSFNNGDALQARKLIMATGGKAAHKLGSTGDGWRWAVDLGHTLTPYYPALVPLETVEQWPANMQGLKVEARVWSTSNGRTIRESTGDLHFTNYGVSGPAAMAHSGSIAPLLGEGGVLLHIDLFPELNCDELDHLILKILHVAGDSTLEEALAGILQASLIPVVMGLVGHKLFAPASSMDDSKRTQLVKTLKDMTLSVAKLRPYKEAQVTAGGLNCDEINPETLQSRIVKDLYFAGEMLDVDGDSGGFNLQWAWSSGHVAGQLGE